MRRRLISVSKTPYTSPEGHAIIDCTFYEGLVLYGQEVPYEKVGCGVKRLRGFKTVQSNLAADTEYRREVHLD